MPPVPLLHRPQRSAHASIRGYLYQACLGALRWLELQPGEVLLCEGDEDLDRYFTSGERTLEQVKDVSGNLGVTVVRETLRNFLLSWVHLRRQNDGVRFVFTSTAEVGKGSPAWPILDGWEDPDGLEGRIDTVRAWVIEASGTEEDQKAVERSLEWLDEGDGWSEFLGAIEWDLEQSDIDGVRDRILHNLKARSDTQNLPMGVLNLGERLVLEIFRASAEPDATNRKCDAEALQRIIKEAQTDLRQWVGSDEAIRLRKVFEEAEALGKLLRRRELVLDPTVLEDRPSTLLTAAYEVIPFVGREKEWGEIQEWCAKSTYKGVWLWFGEGGVGKTRFFIEVCRRLRHQGWHAGFLKQVETGDIHDLFHGVTPRLLVIDYAEKELETTEKLLLDLADHEGTPKVRVVLLARQRGAWWTDLFTESAEAQHLLGFARGQELSPLFMDESARRKGFYTAAAAFARQSSIDSPESLPEPDLSRPEFERVLYLHMAALGAVQGKRLETAEDLLNQTLQHERRFWRLPGPNALEKKDTAESMATAMAGFTLIGGVESEGQAKTWGPHLLDLPNEPTTVRFIRNQLHRLYGTREKNIESLRPDLLGEHLVEQVLAARPHLLDGILDRVDQAQRRQVLTVLLRVAVRTEDESWLQRLEARLRDSADGDEIEGFSAICMTPYFRDAVPLYEVALAAEEGALEWHRKIHPMPTGIHLAERAKKWDHVGLRRNDLGQKELALQATQEAATIFETLAKDQPKVFLPDLAVSLDNLGNRQAEMGLVEESLQTTQRAVEIYEELAQDRPNAVLPGLSSSLHNLGMRYADVGRLEDALQVTQRAVEIRERLVRTNPDAFLLDLVKNLLSLGHQHAAMGQSDEALEATLRAVDLSERLAGKRPDTFLPLLAGSLSNLGNRHLKMEQLEQAVQAIKRAVDIYQRLADRRAESFNQDLASSLNTLSLLHANMGQRNEALEAAERAVGIYERLSKKYPAKFLPALATVLNTLGNLHADIGQIEDALQATRRAVDIREKLARKRPDAFLPDLAMSLNNLGNRHVEMGQPELALQAVQRAVETLLPFFERLPSAYAARMQRATRNYWKRCEESGVEPSPEWMARIGKVVEGLKPLSDT